MTITQILKSITSKLCECIGIDKCNNWATQRMDGAVFDANKNNGAYIGINAMHAPNGYIRLLSEISFSRLALGSCKKFFEFEASFAAVVWANGIASPTELMDKLLHDISKCSLNPFKADLIIDSANFVFDDIFKEETASPEQFPAGLTAAKVSFTIKCKLSNCELTAPICD